MSGLLELFEDGSSRFDAAGQGVEAQLVESPFFFGRFHSSPSHRDSVQSRSRLWRSRIASQARDDMTMNISSPRSVCVNITEATTVTSRP